MSNSSTAFDLNALPGLDRAKHAVRRILAPDVGVQAVLLCGAQGAGAEALARYLAAGFCCPSPTPDHQPCGECTVCRGVEGGTAVDLQVVRPMARGQQIMVRQISGRGDEEGLEHTPVQVFFRTRPLTAAAKVIIFEQAHRMSSDSSHALLKTLEEPPLFAKLILVTDTISRILPTILSRCLVLMCELPARDASDARTPAEMILGEHHPGRIAGIRRAPDAYGDLMAHFESLRKAQPGGALAYADRHRTCGERLAKATGLPDRTAQAEALRALAAWWLARYPHRPQALERITESHRRVLGNVQIGTELDALYAALSNDLGDGGNRI